MIAEQTLKFIKADSSERRLVWACHLIHSLSYGCEQAKTLIGKDLGGIPPLLRTLGTPYFQARHQAAAALASLVTSVQKCRSVFEKSDGVAVSVESMRQIPPSEQAKTELLLLLCAIARTATMAKQLIDLKVIPQVIEMSTNSDYDVKIRGSASGVLAGMASHPSLLPSLRDADIINVCSKILKADPLPEQDSKDPVADRALEILAHISLEESTPSLDPNFAVLIARRSRQLNKRPAAQLSKAEKALLHVLNTATYQFRQHELYRLKIEASDPEAALSTPIPVATKFTATISKLVSGLSDTDDSKAADAARHLLDLMNKEGIPVKKEVLAQEDVFAKLWKLVRQGKLGWDDKWYVSLDPSKVKFKEELGSGAFSTVYKGTLKVKGKKETVAIKALDETVVDLQDFRCEMATMSLLSGLVDNMVGFNGYFYLQQKVSGVMKQTKHYHCIVMELMETNLEDVLHNPKKQVALSPQEILRIAYDIALGMMQLHSYVVLHRDLKPANILLNHKKELPGHWQVRIADFGYARRDSKESLRKSVVGTPAYLAPELVGHTKSDVVGTPADVYSFGVILWEMVSRKKPHDGMDSTGLFHHVISCVEKRTPIFTAPPECEKELGQLLEYCTNPEPRRRPTFAMIQDKLASMLKASGQ